ncbi:MAG: PBP1A family penicillin-binding protein [Synergistaceae bacterium]|nr:PBP1A family penicillin-binding protein [Synergistaceae bacterium]
MSRPSETPSGRKHASPNGAKKEKPRKKRSFLKTFFLGILFLLLLAGAAVSVFVAVYLRDISKDLPTTTEMLAHKANVASVIYDRNGERVARLFTENRQPVELRDISPWIIKAALAAEDSSFYQHGGIRLLSIARAFIENVVNRGVKQGGSTITQQLARNLFLSQERTIERKAKEIILSFRMEQLFTKDRLMEMYMNTIYFGHGAWGVDTAARTYFGKPSSEVTLPEAAILAGLIAAPGRYSPLSNFENAKMRQRYVLERLVTLGWITEEERDAAYAEELVFKHVPNKVQEFNRAPYFVSHILFNELLPKYGPDLVYSGGMEIHTTLDLKMQEAAEKAMKGLKSQGAIVGMDPETGEVLAMVGGHDFAKSKFNRATQAFRQPGSGFKPIVYAAAFESGLMPTDHFLDMKIEYPKKGPNESTWKPENYGKRFHGEVTLEYALVHSLNTVAVRLIDHVGAKNILNVARNLGITSPHVPADLSLALGSASITPLEMAIVFSAFANNGKTVLPLMIREVRSGNGDVLETRAPVSTRGISQESAIVLRSVLLDAVRTGTGTRARLKDRETFGKTGTTNDYSDAWFLGGVPGLVAVVYAGNDDHKPLGKKGATGGVISAPVWKAFVEEAVKDRDLPTKFTVPSEAKVEPVKICRKTGFRAIPGCSAVTVYLPKGNSPRAKCPVHGGDMYAASTDPNAPQLILVHNDSKTYTSSGMYSDASALQPPTAAGPVKVTTPQGPSGAVAPGELVYTDPSPATEVEEKYQKLLKQYGITN